MVGRDCAVAGVGVVARAVPVPVAMAKKSGMAGRVWGVRMMGTSLDDVAFRAWVRRRERVPTPAVPKARQSLRPDTERLETSWQGRNPVAFTVGAGT